MNIDRIKRDIILSEGIRHTAYKDTLNNWTIGVGHLIKLPDEEYLIDKELTSRSRSDIYH